MPIPKCVNREIPHVPKNRREQLNEGVEDKLPIYLNNGLLDMKTPNEKLIEYDTAVLLKKIGFDQSTEYRFTEDRKHKVSAYREPNFNLNWNRFESTKENKYIKYYSRPSQTNLKMWLINKHNLYVEPCIICVGQNNQMMYKVTVYHHWKNGNHINEVFKVCYIESYERAFEIGLLNALKFIENNKNNIIMEVTNIALYRFKDLLESKMINNYEINDKGTECNITFGDIKKENELLLNMKVSYNNKFKKAIIEYTLNYDSIEKMLLSKEVLVTEDFLYNENRVIEDMIITFNIVKEQFNTMLEYSEKINEIAYNLNLSNFAQQIIKNTLNHG